MEWLQFGYFGEDLPIRAGALDAGVPFVPLGQMLKMWDAIERGRPLGPPGFTPGAAPAAAGPAAAPAPAPEPVPQQVRGLLMDGALQDRVARGG